MYIVQGHALYNEKEKELKCLVDVKDHALYTEKELKCLVDVQDHALYYEKS